jgi:TnpA family transposase
MFLSHAIYVLGSLHLVRVAASLKNRTAPANVIVQRLANASSSDRLAGALTALGRIVKTIFVLRYLSDPELRYRVQLQLNRGEARHELVGRCLFFANRGEFFAAATPKRL